MSNFHFRWINKSWKAGHCRPDPAVKITNFCENTKVFPLATFFLAPSAIPAEDTLQCTITYNRSSFTNFAKIFILKTGHIRCYLTGITFATDFLASDRSFESLITGYIYKGLLEFNQYMYQIHVSMYVYFPCLSVAQISQLEKSMPEKSEIKHIESLFAQLLGRLIGCTKSLKTAGSESLVGFIICL